MFSYVESTLWGGCEGVVVLESTLRAVVEDVGNTVVMTTPKSC